MYNMVLYNFLRQYFLRFSACYCRFETLGYFFSMSIMILYCLSLIVLLCYFLAFHCPEHSLLTFYSLKSFDFMEQSMKRYG